MSTAYTAGAMAAYGFVLHHVHNLAHHDGGNVDVIAAPLWAFVTLYWLWEAIRG